MAINAATYSRRLNWRVDDKVEPFAQETHSLLVCVITDDKENPLQQFYGYGTAQTFSLYINRNKSITDFGLNWRNILRITHSL